MSTVYYVVDDDGDTYGMFRTAKAADREAGRLGPAVHVEAEYGCADCGERGESVGHMGCQYPKDRP